MQLRVTNPSHVLLLAPEERARLLAARKEIESGCPPKDAEWKGLRALLKRAHSQLAVPDRERLLELGELAIEAGLPAR